MKEKGQGMVEFAVVLPLLIMLTLSIIYVGAMFLDYQQYSNAARDAARDISLQTATKKVDGSVQNTAHEQRQNLILKINKADSDTLKRYVNPITNLYTPKWSAAFLKNDGTTTTEEKDAVDIQVSIALKRDESMEFGGFMKVLPKELKPIIFKMKIETPVEVIVTRN